MRRLRCTASAILAAALVVATMASAEAQRPERRSRPERPSRSRGERPEKPLRVGDKAVDFDLKRLAKKEGGETVKLSSFEGKQPVVLIFGSYT